MNMTGKTEKTPEEIYCCRFVRSGKVNSWAPKMKLKEKWHRLGKECQEDEGRSILPCLVIQGFEGSNRNGL